MGIDSFFNCLQAIERHHSGLLGKYQDGFCEWLIKKQYSKSTIYNYIPHITQLSCFLSGQGLKHMLLKSSPPDGEIQSKKALWKQDKILNWLENLTYPGVM